MLPALQAEENIHSMGIDRNALSVAVEFRLPPVFRVNRFHISAATGRDGFSRHLLSVAINGAPKIACINLQAVATEIHSGAVDLR